MFLQGCSRTKRWKTTKSLLLALSVEVGLVAKLAGHANPTVTLGHYTQAVCGGEEAVEALERAYGA